MAEEGEATGRKFAELLKSLGIDGSRLQNVKLGPGVVGRNSSVAWVGGLVMLGGVVGGIWLHSVFLVAVSVVGGVLIGVGVPCLNVHFAKKNPAAALLEGAHFVEYHQIQLTASKGKPPGEGGPAGPPPKQLSGGEVQGSLSAGSETGQ